MIKPIEIGPLNTSKKLQYRCESCGDNGEITLTDTVINTDGQGNPNPGEDLNYNCPKCGENL